MRRTVVVSILLLALMLTACSKTPSTTGATTPTAVVTPTAATTLGGIGMGTSTETPSADTAQTYTVQRGTIEDAYTFISRISPTQYTVTSQQDGVVKKILVVPGQSVNEGDLLAQLDATDLQAQLDDIKLTTEQAQRQIDQASQNAQIEVQQAEINLEAAQLDLEQTKEPPSALSIAQARASLREAQSNLDTVHNNASQVKNQAKADMDQAVADLGVLQKQYSDVVIKLKKAKDADKAELETQQKDLETQMATAEAAVKTAVINYDTARNNEVAEVNTAEAQLDLAQAQLDDLLKGPDKYVVAEKERAVRSAQLTLAQARNAAVADPSLVKDVESGKLQVQQLEEQIAARQIIAPIKGKVAQLIALPGDPLQIGSPVLTLGDDSRIELVSQSADMLSSGRSIIPQLTISQPVEVTFSRYPGMTFQGTVSQLATAEVDTVDVTSAYHFLFETQGKSFAAGDQADMKIVLQNKDDVLFLPPAAVSVSSLRSSVTLSDGTKVEVQVGIVTADKVEIVSGLKEGDVVSAK